MRRCGLLFSLVASFACARKVSPVETAAPAASAPAPVSATTSGPGIDEAALAELRRLAELETGGAASVAAGASKDSPLPTCGTTGSYIAVADAECADGSRPLGGNIPAAAGSRRGNVGPNAARHIIDLYEVTCPEGVKRIYVDMYGCDEAQPSRSEIEVQHYLEQAFFAGDFARFSERCLAEEARGPGHVSLMLQTCVQVMPTALRAQGKGQEGSAWLAKYCAGTPPPSEQEPKRYGYLSGVLDAHEALRVRQGISEVEAARERKALTAEYARTCGVDPAAFEAWMSVRASADGGP